VIPADGLATKNTKNTKRFELIFRRVRFLLFVFPVFLLRHLRQASVMANPSALAVPFAANPAWDDFAAWLLCVEIAF
jgi:hypothetical protein